ncbi:RdRP-domain-containing protein [Trametes sanguinea]|nr:RdRP-domain-containing protein [Trametes sanguinea]
MLESSPSLILQARCNDGLHLSDIGLREYASSRAMRAVDDPSRFLLVHIGRIGDDAEVRETLSRWTRIGVVINRDSATGSTRYRFLGFTETQLKQGEVMFFREDHVWTVKRLLESFGNLEHVFHMSGYGKYSAGLGLSFYSTIESLEVLDRELVHIPDFPAPDGSLHTDGCGVIRDSFAQEVCAVHGFPSDTTVFQIHLGGITGLLVRYPDEKFERICGRGNPGRAKVAYRPSMLKYQGGPTVLEISDHNMSAMVAPARLNYQLVVLLLTLGVPYEAFQRMLQDQLDLIGSVSTDRGKALQYIREELDAGFEDNLTQSLYAMLLAQHSLDEPYVRQKLDLFQRTQYDSLGKTLNLRVPDSCCLYGVVDEDGVLGPNEVYINLPSRGGVMVRYVTVGRYPAYYPGDIRTFSAVAHPALRHHRNCIVFSRRAAHSISDGIASGNLGGDLYFVTWDPTLLPKAVVAPLSRSPSLPSPPRQPGGRRDSDMRQAAVDTFMKLKFNPLLDRMNNEWMRQVERTPDLAMGELPLRLVPLLESALDLTKSVDDFRRLEYEFGMLRSQPDANLRPGNYISPMQALRNMVPQAGESVVGRPTCDRSLIIKTENPLLWREFVAEAESVMPRYNRDLRRATKLDRENFAECEDVRAYRSSPRARERKRTDQVECEYRDRYFGGGSRKEYERQRIRASAWYWYGYSKGHAAFAWLGEGYLNEIKALSSNGYKPVMYTGARHWRSASSVVSSTRNDSEATLVEEPRHSHQPTAHTRGYDGMASDELDFSDTEDDIPLYNQELRTPNDCRAPRNRPLKLEPEVDDARARIRARCAGDAAGERLLVSFITHPKPKGPVAQRYDDDCLGHAQGHSWGVQANGTWRRYLCSACGFRVEEKKGADGFWETLRVVYSERLQKRPPSGGKSSRANAQDHTSRLSRITRSSSGVHLPPVEEDSDVESSDSDRMSIYESAVEDEVPASPTSKETYLPSSRAARSAANSSLSGGGLPEVRPASVTSSRKDTPTLQLSPISPPKSLPRAAPRNPNRNAVQATPIHAKAATPPSYKRASAPQPRAPPLVSEHPYPTDPVATPVPACDRGSRHDWTYRGSNGTMRQFTCKTCTLKIKEKKSCSSDLGGREVWIPAG